MLHLPSAWRNERESVTQDHLRLRFGVCGVSEHAVLCLTIKEGQEDLETRKMGFVLKETQIQHKRHPPHVAE